MEIIHNLPVQPYKKFFGRRDSLKNINEILLEGGTFIASIDGVGGIGKTALAYHFCRESLLKSDRFEYIVWLSSKETVFDPFSNQSMIKTTKNIFKGIETLVDITLTVIGFEELIENSFEEKKDFFENDILMKEKIFFVLDNLENINDNKFFEYITKDFNRISASNNQMKILTTSRKRKKIVDFPIEIEGLALEDALSMLKYQAGTYNVKDILKANDHDNIILVEKVSRIPLGIEFIIVQMARGKSRGEIYHELEGYPSLENVESEVEKKKRLSDIILFSFKDMYETLDKNHQAVFKLIAALQKNKSAHDPPISLELLMSITNSSRYDLEDTLDILIENNLISLTNSDEYIISNMSINFVKQFYEDFEEIEDKIDYSLLKKPVVKSDDKVDIFLNKTLLLLEKNEYDEAERHLLKALEVSHDYRIYYELAKIQKISNKFAKASDNFRIATELSPKNVKIWYEWINMEDIRGRFNIAFQIIDKGLEKTDNDVSIFLQKLNIFKYKKKFNELREEVKKYTSIYNESGRHTDNLKLLRGWKVIEYTLLKDNQQNNYIQAVESLLENEDDKEVRLQLLREATRACKRFNISNKYDKFFAEICKIERSILSSIRSRMKEVNRLFSAKKYEEAKKESRKILNWMHDRNEDKDVLKSALHILLSVLTIEKDYNRVITTFEDYKDTGYQNQNCIDIYTKAKKVLLEEEKDNLIKDISLNIQNSEFELRNIVMWSLDFEENHLLDIVRSEGKDDWIEQWNLTKRRSMKNDNMLIHYSDLGQLRAIMKWCNNAILIKVNGNKLKYTVKEILKRVTAYLEQHISKERNETFHSRLQLYETEELNEILVDSNRLKSSILEIKNILKL